MFSTTDPLVSCTLNQKPQQSLQPIFTQKEASARSPGPHETSDLRVPEQSWQCPALLALEQSWHCSTQLKHQTLLNKKTIKTNKKTIKSPWPHQLWVRCSYTIPGISCQCKPPCQRFYQLAMSWLGRNFKQLTQLFAIQYPQHSGKD